jgi:hypothetical protein
MPIWGEHPMVGGSWITFPVPYTGGPGVASLRHFSNRAAVLQVGRDPGTAEGVVEDFDAADYIWVVRLRSAARLQTEFKSAYCSWRGSRGRTHGGPIRAAAIS